MENGGGEVAGPVGREMRSAFWLLVAAFLSISGLVGRTVLDHSERIRAVEVGLERLDRIEKKLDDLLTRVAH